MSRTSTLPRRLPPMLATLTDAPFDDPGWVFEDKYDGFRMIAEIRRGKVAPYAVTARSSAAAISMSPKRWRA
jgi:bifunctional non-homologous end joining protein LigD